ncbi:hypothetical protein L596_006292 [Steinernema carpocapsae]|uniref:non-specific serine/threonine protein kinase n=1 Tax=Steinernema carpocapsae TaxID=34508 RepID=A0A4U8V1Q2_STECR|nr:hypothetical protein L596_006292 [Steinernema carpocapsae]
MGVLLYTLLCGALPFEDDSVQDLYKKIIKGVYPEPDFLSFNSRALLKGMLQVNPRKRMTIQDLLTHPWMNHTYSQPLKWNTIFDKNIVDEEVARELAAHYNHSVGEMIERIKQWSFDYLTATYLLLLQRKLRGQKFALPGHRNTGNPMSSIITSPTIHASLERDLDRSGLEDDSSDNSGQGPSDIYFARPLSPKRVDPNMYKRPDFTPSIMTGRTPGPTKARNVYDTPIRTRPQQVKSTICDKENERPSSVRLRGTVNINEAYRPKSIVPAYCTPKRPEAHNVYATPARRRESPTTPSTPGDDEENRTPRSNGKTSRLRTRVFASLERKADRMINLLTPRRLKNDGPTVLKHTKNMVNVSMTSSNNPHLVKSELISGFQKQGITVEENGWKIFGKEKDAMGRSMTVELQVVFIETLKQVGVQRRRINGDAFLYKKVCEQVLRLSGL